MSERSPAASRRAFPNAEEVVAGSFDGFYRKLQAVEATLPVVEAEAGDTWYVFVLSFHSYHEIVPSHSYYEIVLSQSTV